MAQSYTDGCNLSALCASKGCVERMARAEGRLSERGPRQDWTMFGMIGIKERDN